MTRPTAILDSTRHVMLVLCLLFGLGAASVGQGAELPTTREVLDRFVAAVGGRAAMEKIESRHFRGTIVQDLSWKDPQHQETPFVAETDAEGLVRYAESSSWQDLPVQDRGEPRNKLRWVMHPRFALEVEQFFPELEVQGREQREDRSVIVLVPRDLPRNHYSLYFDEETGLLAHIGYYNDLEDWQELDGILVPMRWAFSRKGGHTTYVVEEIRTGPAPRAH